MDRNMVLQDLHTYHNPPPTTTTTTTTTTTSNINYSNTPLQQQQQAPFHNSNNNSNRMFSMNDTQQHQPTTSAFLDGIDFTGFDSRLFTPQQYMNPYQHPPNTNTSNYLNMYPQLLQRYNSNGSTTSSNSQTTTNPATTTTTTTTTTTPHSYLQNYSPMAHYTASMQHQQNSYYSQQQQQLQHLQQQYMNNNTTLSDKKRKTVQNEMLAVKKPKAKKKKTKIIDPNAPPKPKRKTGLNKPLLLSPALSELMDGAIELSRPELVQKLWKYIKLNNLQDPADRRFILCDDQLKKIFNQDRINSFGMNKDLSAHLTKKPEQPKETTTTTTTPKENDDFLL